MKKEELIKIIDENFTENEEVKFYIQDYEYASNDFDCENLGQAEYRKIEDGYIILGINE